MSEEGGPISAKDLLAKYDIKPEGGGRRRRRPDRAAAASVEPAASVPLHPTEVTDPGAGVDNSLGGAGLAEHVIRVSPGGEITESKAAPGKAAITETIRDVDPLADTLVMGAVGSEPAAGASRPITSFSELPKSGDTGRIPIGPQRLPQGPGRGGPRRGGGTPPRQG